MCQVHKMVPFFSLYWFLTFKTNDPSLNSIPIAKLQTTTKNNISKMRKCARLHGD